MLVPRDILDLALPLVKELPECADFSKTVQPFLPQLYDLPYKLLESVNDRQALLHIYASTNPLMLGLAFALFMTPIVLVVSEINRNYSQVDRLWSILPVIYNVHYDVWAHLNGLPTAKLDHVMALSVIWGARLTFNYWRKGGYQVGSEDYRWNTVKDYVGPVPMFIFNVVFISLAQNVSTAATQYRTPLTVSIDPTLDHYFADLRPTSYVTYHWKHPLWLRLRLQQGHVRHRHYRVFRRSAAVDFPQSEGRLQQDCKGPWRIQLHSRAARSRL